MSVEMSPQEILECFKSFIDGVTTKSSRSSRNFVDSALTLLRVLPVSRTAVLDYLGNIHKECFREYLSRPQNSDKNEAEEIDPTIKKVATLLTELTSSDDSSFWPSMLSKWCIRTLGEMSHEYSNHRMLPTTLHELIKFCTSCHASHSLVTILCMCLSNLDEDEMYPCFDSLLVNSMKLNPYFDWVVACTGSCFPDAIITRMLQCGLVDYHRSATNPPIQPPLPPSHPIMPPSARLFQTQVQGPPPLRVHPPAPLSSLSNGDAELENVSRIPQVVGILSFLALDFEDKLEEKMFSLFETSLGNDASDEYLIGPLYIFHLSTLSSVLFKIILKAFVDRVDMATINKMVDRAQKRNFRNQLNYASTVGLMARTLRRTEIRAFEIMKFLMDAAVAKDLSGTVAPLPIVSQFCSEVMNELCTIMQKVVFSSSMNLSPEVQILFSLRNHSDDFCRLLVESNDCRRNWLFKFLSCLSVGDTRETACGILFNIFSMDTNLQDLSCFIELQKCAEIKHVDIISDVADRLLSILEASEDLNMRQRILEKMLNLSRWEIDPKNGNKELTFRQPLFKALQSRHLDLILLFRRSCLKMRSDLLKLLNILGSPLVKDDVTLPFKLARETVFFFFEILKTYEGMEKMSLAYECIKYLKNILFNKAIQVAIIVWTLESSLLVENCKLFGGANDGKVVNSGDWLEPLFSKPNLMEQNRMVSCSSFQVFHSGEIGSRPKRMKPCDPTPEIRLNSRLVLEVVWSCGRLNFEADKTSCEEPQCTQDVMNVVGSTLVDFIMPDGLMNSTLWPEEDFLKTSAERDLHVRRMLDNNPLLWHFMDFVFTISPNTWSCLCILRSLLGNLIIQWESSRETSSRSLPHLLVLTQRVIEYLRKAQVLLEPLSYSVELLQHISPYEVYLVLLNIWRYVKEYCPQTGLKKTFTCPVKILDVIHAIIQNNIENCGHLFPLFFSV